MTYRNAAKEGPSHGHRGSAKKFVKIGPAVPELQSDRQTDRNTPLPYRGGVITMVATTTSSLHKRIFRRCGNIVQIQAKRITN